MGIGNSPRRRMRHKVARDRDVLDVTLDSLNIFSTCWVSSDFMPYMLRQHEPEIVPVISAILGGFSGVDGMDLTCLGPVAGPSPARSTCRSA